MYVLGPMPGEMYVYTRPLVMQGIFRLKCAALVSDMVSHPEIGGDVGRFREAILIPVVLSRSFYTSRSHQHLLF